MQNAMNGMSGLNAQSLQDMQQRLQQQLAQQQQQQQFARNAVAQPQQAAPQAQMMAAGNMTAAAFNAQQQLAALQRQSSGVALGAGGVAAHAAGVGAAPQLGGNNAVMAAAASNPALAAMLQQQQQQQHNSNAANTNPLLAAAAAAGMPTSTSNAMFGGQQQQQAQAPQGNVNWNAQAAPSPMDASSGSSARLMAMAGMGGSGNLGAALGAATGTPNQGMNLPGGVMGGVAGAGAAATAPSSSMQNMQLLLQHQQQQKAAAAAAGLQQQQQLATNNSMGNFAAATRQQQQPQAQQQQQAAQLGGGANASLLLQRQLASLQKQMQQQQQQQQGGGTANGRGGVGAGGVNNAVTVNLQTALQQQQQRASGGGTDATRAGAPSAANNPQQQMLRAQQQQLLQQMQQQQGNAAGAGTTNTTANSTGTNQQQQHPTTALGMLQQQQQQQSTNTANTVMGIMQQQRHSVQHRASTASNSSTAAAAAAVASQFNNNNTGSNNNSTAPSPAGSTSKSGLEERLRMQQQLLQQRSNSVSSSGPTAQQQLQQQQQQQRNSHNLASALNNSNSRSQTPQQQQQQQQLNFNFLQQQQALRNASGGSSTNNNQQQQQSSSNDNNNPFASTAIGVAIQDSSQRSVGSNTSSGGGGGNAAASGGGGDNNSTTGSTSGAQQQPSDQQAGAQQQAKTFLDGSFAGGWQSNADLPDRRQVIFRILEVIRQMRPDANRVPTNRLPHMAKSLEEHLYRLAQTKEEYMDLQTLKRRLQSVVHNLETRHQGNPAAGGQQQQVNGGTSSASFHSTTNGTAAAGGTSSSSASQQQNSNWPGSNNNSLLGGGTAAQQQIAALQQQHGNTSNLARTLVQQQRQQQLGGAAGSAASLSGQQQQANGSSFGAAGGGGNSSNLLSQNSMHSRTGSTGVAGLAGANQQQQGLGNNGAQSRLQQVFGSGQESQQQQQQPATIPGWGQPSGSAQAGGASDSDPAVVAQKKRVILQQQQRLLLLRHASKCTAGANCKTRFCSQMKTLWRHMKACRDKNCKTSHCVSSRCVLNHYRICKSNGKTGSCEVCGPVMTRIRQQERDDGAVDPLTKDQDLASLRRAAGSGTPQLPSSSSPTPGQQVSDATSDEAQLQQVQAQQMKLKAQLDSLKQLQKRQEELLKQQRRLELHAQQIQDPTSPQAQQLQQQQTLLQHLQKKCQQQQLLLQQEVHMQMNLDTSSSTPSLGVAQQQQPAPQLLPQMRPALGLGSLSSIPEEDLEQDTGATSGVAAAARISAPQQANQGSSSRGRTGSGSGGKGRRGGKKSLTISSSAAAAAASSSITAGAAAAAAMQSTSPRKRPSVSSAAGNDRKRAAVDSSLVQPTASATGVPSANTKKTDHESTSLIPFMTKQSIQQHLESLNKRIRLSSRTVTHKCMPLVDALINDQFGWVFKDPVDPVALGLPDYFEVVKTPMHLDLVKKKLENAIYSDMESCARDTKLVFENAILYNGASSEVGELAQTFLTKFSESYGALVQEIESSHLKLEKNGEMCSLCGTQNRRFEPTVLYCQGECRMQRINRGAMYYTDRTKLNHWCESCYESLDDGVTIVLDDGSEVGKKDLQSFKNDALPEEGWVNCDTCNSWVHQVCSLFNGRANKSNARYTCPNCYLKRVKDNKLDPKENVVKSAVDLPRCKMSDAIEQGLSDTLKKAYKDRADELGVSIDEVEKAERLTVRVVANSEKKHMVGEEMLQRYGDKGCPTEYPVRTKCIALFQEIHGVDALLFSVYVYEYGQECAAPNRRRVYISYLDSVQYFEPKCYRSVVYHSVLVEYLRFVKKRGFHTAHIWSCPPTAGDEYIFFSHPPHQLTPREDMLRSWYHRMLDRAKAEGIVLRTSTLYDDYFVEDGMDSVPWSTSHPTCLPYFEGDYVSGEIENIIRVQRQKRFEAPSETEPDSVMARLGHNLKKMKDNFIVVHLRSKRFAEAVERGEDVSNWKDGSDEEIVRNKRAKISGKDSSVLHQTKDVKELVADARANAAAAKDSVDGNSKIGQEAVSVSPGIKRNYDDLEPGISLQIGELTSSGKCVADTSDEDEPLEAELFESRQRFLNYCQTAHCQFDELRRAKHSTMMILFQLHNPAAPLFLNQCGACYRDITHGVRFHCNDCSNFDLCEECYEPVTTGLWAKRDARFGHDKSHTFSPVDMEASAQGGKSKEERQKSLKAHVALLEHAGTCEGAPGCSSQNCQRMKKLFGHVKNCEVKPKTDCRICTRLLSLCAMHSRTCSKRGVCPIPFCDRIRERNKRLRRQQQLMDDRRRQAQNDLYHASES